MRGMSGFREEVMRSYAIAVLEETREIRERVWSSLEIEGV